MMGTLVIKELKGYDCQIFMTELFVKMFKGF